MGQALARIEEQGLSALEELCSEYPESADALRSRVGWLVERGLVTPGRARSVPRELGNFRLGELLGAGGMGVVYRARDAALDREVAVKVVRPEQLFFPGARDRFQREVTAVASLQHPGIVPIYSVGEDDGLPYFAMELVHGATLADVIEHLTLGDCRPAELEGADLALALTELTGEGPLEGHPSPLFDGPWPAVVARIAREVAEALEHAHRRGILHRDIKPSNVMLTRDGRVLLVDFGLSMSSEGQRLTKTGHIVGSMAYMAPELLRDAELSSPRTEVWSLGVTLYELLTLALPQAESGAGPERLLIGDALAGAIAKLRSVDARISWELETIVQTAVEVDPGRRYASAGEFGQDLERALTGREISARRASTALRVKRWAQRHPGLSTAALLGLFVFTFGPTLFAWQQIKANRELAAKSGEVRQANQRLEDALLETETQRDEARVAMDEARVALGRSERNFDRTTRAVDMMVTELGGDLLQGVPQAEGTRVKLLEAALALNEELLSEPESDASQQWLTLETLTRLAELNSMLGRQTDALENLSEQESRLRVLLDSEPSAEWKTQLAETLRLETAVLGFLERYEAALEPASEAVRLGEELVEIEGPGYLASLGNSRLDLGQLLRFAGRPADGIAQIEQAVDELRAAAREIPSLENRVLLASGLARRGSGDGWFDDESPDATEAEARLAALDEAIEMREEIVLADPDPEYRQQLASSRINRSTLLGRSPEARLDMQRAVELTRGLAREHPNLPRYRELHGAALYGLVGVSLGVVPAAELVEQLATAVSELEIAVEFDPNRPLFGLELLLAAQLRGSMLLDERRDSEALEVLERATELALDLHARGLLDVHRLHTARAAAGRRSHALIRMGRYDEAAEAALLLERFEPPPPEIAYIGLFLARCAAFARQDPRGLFQDRVEGWVDDAIRYAFEALEAGATAASVTDTFTNPDLAPLDDHPVFSAFREELAAQ